MKQTENHKKILCKNITNNGKCLYTQKCVFAHTLDEQKVDKIRLEAYNIIKGTNNLSQINLIKDQQLYNTLVSLTTVCELCITNKCTGGYNCKHGACKNKYVICHTDLNKGTCNKCDNIHLTIRGLVPYCAQIINNLKIKTNTNKNIQDSDSDSSVECDVSWCNLVNDAVIAKNETHNFLNNDINNRLNKSIFNM